MKDAEADDLTLAQPKSEFRLQRHLRAQLGFWKPQSRRWRFARDIIPSVRAPMRVGNEAAHARQSTSTKILQWARQRAANRLAQKALVEMLAVVEAAGSSAALHPSIQDSDHWYHFPVESKLCFWALTGTVPCSSIISCISFERFDIG